VSYKYINCFILLTK